MLAGLVRKVSSLGAPASVNALGFESCLRNAGNYLMRVSQEASRGFSTGTDTTGVSAPAASKILAPEEAAPDAGPKLDLLEKYMAIENKSRAEKGKIANDEFRHAFKRHEADTGSSSVQVAALSYKISMMTEHLQEHRKDNHSRRGLMSMLVRRQKLLKYMRRKEPDDYQMVLKTLGLKDRTFVGNKY
mmetsp:Transcript_20769/g.45511  ORF Transcript_20769/g.45511 Transcript_20769/m.45511 type:complete len:188 (-) Transcript_20769:42-605(-)